MPLEPPPRDLDGNVLPHDHQGITDDEGVIRRISENQIVIDKTGQRRISSIAFRPSCGPTGGMSIDLQALIEEAGLDAREFVTTPRWTGSVRFKAQALRSLELQIGFRPLPDNPFHGEVWGKFPRAKQRQLQQLAVWFVPIEDVVIV